VKVCRQESALYYKGDEKHGRKERKCKEGRRHNDNSFATHVLIFSVIQGKGECKTVLCLRKARRREETNVGCDCRRLSWVFGHLSSVRASTFHVLFNTVAKQLTV
jgi:hypothetical protein